MTKDELHIPLPMSLKMTFLTYEALIFLFTIHLLLKPSCILDGGKSWGLIQLVCSQDNRMKQFVELWEGVLEWDELDYIHNELLVT